MLGSRRIGLGLRAGRLRQHVEVDERRGKPAPPGAVGEPPSIYNGRQPERPEGYQDREPGEREDRHRRHSRHKGEPLEAPSNRNHRQCRGKREAQHEVGPALVRHDGVHEVRGHLGGRFPAKGAQVVQPEAGRDDEGSKTGSGEGRAAQDYRTPPFRPREPQVREQKRRPELHSGEPRQQVDGSPVAKGPQADGAERESHVAEVKLDHDRPLQRGHQSQLPRAGHISQAEDAADPPGPIDRQLRDQPEGHDELREDRRVLVGAAGRDQGGSVERVAVEDVPGGQPVRMSVIGRPQVGIHVPDHDPGQLHCDCDEDEPGDQPADRVRLRSVRDGPPDERYRAVDCASVHGARVLSTGSLGDGTVLLGVGRGGIHSTPWREIRRRPKSTGRGTVQPVLRR